MTDIKRQDFRFFIDCACDMQKIDTAISDYWRALALPYEATMLSLGGHPLPARL